VQFLFDLNSIDLIDLIKFSFINNEEYYSIGFILDTKIISFDGKKKNILDGNRIKKRATN
jgi:hypothetical protein